MRKTEVLDPSEEFASILGRENIAVAPAVKAIKHRQRRASAPVPEIHIASPDQQRLADYEGQVRAIRKSQAVIEFAMDGTILDANENFLRVMGYSFEEVKGKHHSIFIDEATAGSEEYQQFWAALNRGEYHTAEYKRIGKDGREVWIQASYNPILNADGTPFKVVKYATEITARKMAEADYQGQITAVRRSLAVIEFNMDGVIRDANENFLHAVGYALDEIQGKHHSIFVDKEYAKTAEYRGFWEALNRGEYQAAEYKRLGKNGREVWIQASYSPILDANGKPFKVVKYAIDVTEQKQALHAMIADAMMLSNAAVDGNLDARADASQHEGDYRKIIEGVNQTLDAVIGPLKVSADYVRRISRGDIPSKITDEYFGDFNEIKKSLNTCIDTLNGLIAEMQRMSEEHNRGDIDVVIPVQKFQGSYRVMAQGVNEMVAGHIVVKKKAMACVAEFGRGNFEAPLEQFPGKKAFINETIEQVRSNLQALIADTDMLAKAAGNGNLAVRADASRHNGDFRSIVEGINKTLETVIEPLRISSANASALASSSEELTSVSQQMAGNAEETATQANAVSAASSQISKSVSSVATAAEEMQISIREIARSANESARVATKAVEVADSANHQVSKLGDSSREVGNVIKVISSIAQQTNLLALNATIEAARAGEAGKGFAVVANEVKELARQTAQATEDIGRKIDAIQTDTKGAVHAIEEIGVIINQVNEISSSIASAVEEQAVTTSEISRNVSEAAQGVDDISKNIGGVAIAARNTTEGAMGTQLASQELSRMANELQGAVAKFRF